MWILGSTSSLWRQGGRVLRWLGRLLWGRRDPRGQPGGGGAGGDREGALCQDGGGAAWARELWRPEGCSHGFRVCGLSGDLTVCRYVMRWARLREAGGRWERVLAARPDRASTACYQLCPEQGAHASELKRTLGARGGPPPSQGC